LKVIATQRTTSYWLLLALTLVAYMVLGSWRCGCCAGCGS